MPTNKNLPLDKGCGFTIVNDTAKKIEEQLDKATKAKLHPINRLKNKIQKNFGKLGKKKINKQNLF